MRILEQGLRRSTVLLIVVLVVVVGLAGGYGLRRASSNKAAEDLPAEVLDYADLVLYNGKILTVDKDFSIADAVAVRDDRVLAVGTRSDVMELSGPDTQKIDLQGKSVVPGFVDSDGDNAFAGGDLYKDTMVNGVVGEKIEGENVRDMLAQVEDLVAEAEPGSPVYGRMSDEFASNLSRLTRDDLDELAPDNPLMLSLSSSEGVVNSAMLEAAFEAGLPRDHFQVVKDASGRPTGQLFGRAIGFVGWNMRDWPELTDKIFNEQEEINNEFLKVGVTTVTGHASGYTVTIMNQLFHQDRLHLRIRPDLDFVRQNPEALEMIRRTPNLIDFGLGDGMLRIVGAAVGPVDGASDSGGILTNEPKLRVHPLARAETNGQNKWTAPQWTDKQWEDLTDEEKQDTEWLTLQLLRKHGWNIGGNHNMGAGASLIVMRTLLEAEEQDGIKVHDMLGRNALDHNLIWDEESMALAQQLGDDIAFGLNAEVWNQREVGDDQMLTYQYGNDMLNTMQPVKDLIEAGLNVHFEGGDPEEPPLWRIERFVTRTDKNGKVWGADQAIDREQALRMVTYSAAVFISEEDELGSIEPGKYADLVVLSGDYTAVPDDKIDELNPIMTIVGGEVVYESEG